MEQLLSGKTDGVGIGRGNTVSSRFSFSHLMSSFSTYLAFFHGWDPHCQDNDSKATRRNHNISYSWVVTVVACTLRIKVFVTRRLNPSPPPGARWWRPSTWLEQLRLVVVGHRIE